MSEKIWLGRIYLKEEGGYKIVLRALAHYKKRLMTIDKSPELRDSAAMFGGILRQAAMNTLPKIDEITKKIQKNLQDPSTIDELNKDIPFLEKALVSYEADIQKALDTGHEYYLKLVGNLVRIKDDLDSIKTAKSKIKEFEQVP